MHDLYSLLYGLISSGVYYLAQQNRDYLKTKKGQKELLKKEIYDSLENELGCIFPELSKAIPEIKGIDEEQIKCLQKLFIQTDRELEDALRRTIEGSLYVLSLFGPESERTTIDMFSMEGFGQTLAELKNKTRGMESLKDETILFVVPRLFFRMLQEITTNPELNNIVAIIRDCQNARFQKTVIERLTQIQKGHEFDYEMISNAVNSARHKLKAQATRLYDIKMAGSEPDMANSFDYMPPRMLRVKKEGKQIQAAFDKKHTEPIDTEAFIELFLQKKRILVIADAGGGKTTFLRRMQLELLQKRLSESPLPVFEDVRDFYRDSRTLIEKTAARLQETWATNYSTGKAEQIAGILNEHGRLCILLDSLDQCDDHRACESLFQMGSGIHENNRVVVTCRTEHVKKDPNFFRDKFFSYEWIILEGFNKEQLIQYLGPEVSKWLDYPTLPENFQHILRIPFYANTTKRIGLRPASERKRIENRGDLLCEFEVELYKQARTRGIDIKAHREPKIKKFLYQLSLETLTEKHIQTFSSDFLDKHPEEQHIIDIIFNTHWIFFNRTLFETRDSFHCTFYHQLLQEFFAARRLEQLFKIPDEFDKALIRLPFSTVVLDLLDDLLPHEPVFNYCMNRFEEALAWADKEKRGIEDSGHKFTWLLALRDRKGNKPELQQRLQEIFNAETEQMQKKVKMDGKFVLVPAGAYIMGGYGYYEKTRIMYETDFWISKYPETFHEYDEYCKFSGKKKPSDENWGREDRPVINVTWKEAFDYVSWKGKEYSLPTRSQWEKAARGKLGRRYPWGNVFDKEKCNTQESGIGQTSPVTRYPDGVSPVGCNDMVGNVYELISPYNYKKFGGYTISGGSWGSGNGLAHCDSRDVNNPYARSSNVGFRCFRIKS